MPRMGEAHLLLSPTHPDTSPPAGGADPDDGQVATWSAALGAWIAADPAGGVTDHGALTGLFPDDDHAQYALADKSRPSPWVEAADLSPRSLADLGTKAHDLLTGLGDDDHSIYALLAGRSGGQSFVGDIAASGHLTLQATAHATRGYVRAQDDLQLLSDVMRDSGGNARVTLAAASPHVALTGDLDVSGHIAAGSAAAPNATKMLNVDGGLAVHPAYAAYLRVYGNAASGPQFTMGIGGGAIGEGTPSAAYVYGLYFFALHDTSSVCGQLIGQYLVLQSGFAGSGGLSLARGLWLGPASWAGSKPNTIAAIDIDQQGGAGAGTAYGLRIADQTATTARLLELGPAVPYLRLLGGANPAANQSHLSLKFGATLKLLTEGDADSGGAGFRQVIVQN